MRVLMISGDKTFAASPRYALQAAQVEQLEVIYWGPGNLWPAIPPGLYAVVTAQDPFWRGLLAWILARWYGARLNVQVHTDLSAQSFLRRLLAGVVLRRADSIRVVSEKLKRQVEQIHVRARVHVLPICIDVERFRALARKPHERKTLLWIGRFETEKDPLYAIFLLDQVRRLGIDARLIMLGSGSLERAVRERARGLPVEFPGWRDPAAYLEVADVVISTSRHESYGASVIEALAAGVPVVAPDVGVAKEAGAVVAARTELAPAVISVLRSDTRGELKMPVLNAAAWAVEWRKTL